MLKAKIARLLTTAALGIFALMATHTNAQAGFITGVTGGLTLVGNPSGLDLNDNATQQAIAFDEKMGVAGGGVNVDTLVNTLPSGFTDGKGGSGGMLPTGNYDSAFVHFDINNTSLSATITFSTAITGLIYTRNDLDPTDPTFGHGLVTYPTGSGAGNRQLEGNDTVFISADRKTLTLNWAIGSQLDQLRVITAPANAVPVPAGMLLALTGLPMVGAVGWFRRRVSASA